MKSTILIIDDEKIMRSTLEYSLKEAGYDVLSAGSGSEGLQILKDKTVDLLVSDIKLPDKSGIEILEELNPLQTGFPVILITAFGTIEDAVQAMKIGAYDYITKPFSLDEFMMVVQRALEVKRLKEDNIRLRQDISKCYGLPCVIGESEEIKQVLALVDKVARTDSTVLITGESGTGKELIASTIHYQSSRHEGPFIRVNSAALPETLIESELFGYEKGAFTGATKRKPGRFELANGGTIFLDEVGDLPPSTQVKLLRVLQDGSFERLGGTDTIVAKVRVIAATNQDLEEAVKRGDFREDLYYRLNVIPIAIPPLKNRREDVFLLVDHFLGRYNSRFGKRTSFSADALERLTAYDFPGNVRELENIVERCVALAESQLIGTDQLPAHISRERKKKSPIAPLSKVVSDAEREHVIQALKATGGNRTKAAEILGISRKNLWEKMNALGIEV